MKLVLASDHGGYDLKEEIKKYLEKNGYDYTDIGTHSKESVDYPTFGKNAARMVADGEFDQGILVCGTGLGISMAANKIKGIRCAVVSDTFSAKMARAHNNANMLALGGRVVGAGLALEIVEVFLQTEFEGGRHACRVDQIE